MDLTVMRRACVSTERFVAQVTPAHYAMATPCTEWDVRALLNHLVGTLALGQALLGDTPPTVRMGPGELPEGDLVGEDPLKAYRLGVESLLAAADDDAFERAHQTPLGEMPGTLLGGFTTLDIVVHGWDLAKATGQPAALEAGLAERALAFARQTITEGTRAPLIGPELAVPADAPATDRLVGFLGRTP